MAKERKYSGAHIATNLKSARKAKGIRQAQAASRMGMARTTIVAIEQGKRPVHADEMADFAILYDTTIDALTHVDDLPTDTPSANARIHVYYGYSARKSEKGEKCFYCGKHESRFAYTYFGAPLCKSCWDNDWRQDDEGKTDPPFDEINREVSGEWL